MTIEQKVLALIRDFNGIKEPRFKRVSFPTGVYKDTPHAIVLYLTPMPTHALLDAIREDLEYLREAH